MSERLLSSKILMLQIRFVFPTSLVPITNIFSFKFIVAFLKFKKPIILNNDSFIRLSLILYYFR